MVLEYFNMGSKDECIKHLLKNSDTFTSNEFCDVWEHFVDFMFYKTLGTFVEKMSEMFTKILCEYIFSNAVCSFYGVESYLILF